MLLKEWKHEEALVVRYEEGVEDGLFQAAKSMLAKGMSVDLISEITGLGKNEIESFTLVSTD
jgi:hypothetical protein